MFLGSLDYFVVVLYSFVVLGLTVVSSVLCYEIGWALGAERLRNDLFCVQLDVKA